MLRLLKQRLKRAYYAARGLRPDIRIPVTTVNPGAQAWYFALNSLKPGDVVYSLGLATNIEFDLNLIRDCGVEIHGFDPTPESVDWIQMQTLPPQFHPHPVAIAGYDGELIFELPDREGHCARAWNPKSKIQNPKSTRSVTVPCKRISSLMRELGHGKISLLKMDIEGSEYDVIEDILAGQLDIPQILVEFHHRFEGIGIKNTLRVVAALRRAGYRLFHISPWCEEFAFLKE